MRKGSYRCGSYGKRGGIIIIVAECADGKGGEAFYSTLKNCNSPAELYDEIMAVPQDKTIPDQWQSQILVRVLKSTG